MFHNRVIAQYETKHIVDSPDAFSGPAAYRRTTKVSLLGFREDSNPGLLRFPRQARLT